MLPEDVGAATDRPIPARVVQATSVACFLLAAGSMLVAAALHASGNVDGASTSATLGYAVGVLGIVTGILALIFEPPQETS